MATAQIETVVFDLGGVLVDWDPRYLYRKIFDDEAAMERFLSEVCHPEWHRAMDGGRPLHEATESLCAEHPAFEAEIRAYGGRWPEMLAGAIDGTVALLDKLHAAGVPLYAITNWSADTWGHALDRFAFLDRFRDVIVSGREKLLKPQPEIYRLLLDRHGLPAAGCLFIDDVPANVEGARSVGMNAVLFTSPDVLAHDLRAHGLPL